MTARFARVSDQGDGQLVAAALANDELAIRALIQKYNRRLYRIARGIVGDDAEAEDVVQDAYVRAFAALASYRGEASLATWLTRILVNEALQRLRYRQSHPLDDFRVALEIGEMSKVVALPTRSPLPDPEVAVAQREICLLVERAIDTLPIEFRAVLIARAIEGMSTEETAAALDLRSETVKTRLHRARQMLKAVLDEHLETQFAHAFPFDGERCRRIADGVVAQLRCHGNL